jgi:deoxycytidylate deaminase
VEGSTLYCTHSPCLDCSKLIINSGIKRVVYGNAYRKEDGPNLLRSVGIPCDQVTKEPGLRIVLSLGIGGDSVFMGQRTEEEPPPDGCCRGPG